MRVARRAEVRCPGQHVREGRDKFPQSSTWHKQRNQNKDTHLYDWYHFGFPWIKNVCPGPGLAGTGSLSQVICHINNWLEILIVLLKCHQYQMCKQLIKTTLSVLIVANWLHKLTWILYKSERGDILLTMFPWLEPEPSVSCLCQRLPTMLLRFLPTSSCILSSPLRAYKVNSFNFLSSKM